jgi:hypothetical protein
MGVFRKSWWNTCVRVGLGLFFLRALREASNTKGRLRGLLSRKEAEEAQIRGLDFL